MYVPMPKSRMRRASMTTCSILCPGRFVLPGVERETRGQSFHAPPDAGNRLLIAEVGEHHRDQPSDFAHLFLAEAARSNRGRAQTNAARVQRLVGIERNRILVDG